MFDQYNDWMTDRLGKFTASEIWKLTEKGRGGEYFGKGAKTYIRQKAAEILTMEQVNGGRANSNAMEWGNAHEFEAFERFLKETGLKDAEHYGGANPKFFDYTALSGGSPDGKGETYVLEIKCPYNAGEHLEHLMLSCWEDLRSYYPEAYWQLTFNMICTNTNIGFFISYDPRFADDELQIKILQFRLVESDRDYLIERLTEAEKQLTEIIKKVRPA